MLVGCLASRLRLSREAISMGGGRRIRTSTSDLFRCLGYSSLKLVFTLLLLDVLVKHVAADPSQSICTNSERVVAPGLATPKKLEERSCAVTTNSLCAWVAASFLTENVARAVTGANTQPLAGEFNEQWFGASTRRRGLAAADSGVSQQEYITKGGFVTLLCSSSGNTCTSPSYAVHADENESWEDHFKHQLEQSNNVQGTLLSAMREVNTTLAKTMQENIAAALEVAGEDGAWFSSPFLLCGNAVQDFIAGSSSRQSDGSIKLTSCLTARPGSSLPGFDVGIMLYATFHIRVIPPESLPEAFHAVRARLPRDDPTGNRTEGLVAMSYFLDVEDGEVLPCDSRIVLPCTIANVKLLASRIKADFFSCGRDERCMNSVIEGVTRYTRYTIGKEITQDYFYAFIVDEQGDFIAHGANSALVGRNLNDVGSEATDFHGRRAFDAIHKASVRDDGFGSYATYLWPSASCQNSLTGGLCEPLVKNALTFSVRTLRTKLIVGVGSNHMRPPFPVKDPSAPALGFCSDAYSLPCADEAARRLVSYTQSALRSSNSGKVFADITSGSSEYKVGNFYVFILDFKSAEFLAHGAIPRLVEEKVTIINAASSVGLRPDQLSGDTLFMDMQERAEMGGGYVAYNWTHPVYAVVPKISFMLGFRISDGDSALRDVIIGSGFYLSAAPQILESTKNGRQKSCSLTMNTACSRRMLLSKVGYTLSTFIDAMTIGKEAVANTIQNMNMNEIVDERVIINSQKDWPGRDSQWANIGVSLFHRLQGTLIASNKPCKDGNGTWGMRYSGMTEAFILKAEGRYDSDNSYSQESQKASDDGGAFFEWETPHGNRWGYISQLVCSLDFLSSGDSCAYLIVDEANLGCGDGSRVVDDICIPCPAGEYLDTDKCVPCAPGSYSSRPGEKKCTLCRDLPDAQRRYQNATGATKCELCPDNTMRDLTDSATSIAECHCAEGFYQQDLLPNGALCSPCEEGGVCPGALGKINLEPYPQPGYWGQRGYPSEFLECELGEFACKGGENFTCADERHGTLCTLCGKGYFKAYATGWDGGPSGEGACYKCAGGFLQWIYTALMTSAIFAVWFGLNEVPYEALNVSLEFMQISDIIGKFSLEWPATMASFWQVLSQIVNFDPDIVVMWQCHMPWDFKDGFVLLMVLPFVKVTAIGFFHLAKYISLYLIRTGRIQKFPRGLLTTQKEMDDSDDVLINELIAFHHILYLALTERAFDIFATAPRPDGVEFIEEAPWIDVNSSSYAGLQILGSFAIAVYVIGMPAFFAWSEFLVHIGHELMRANDEVVDSRTGEENDDAGVAKDLLALGLSKTFVSDGVEAFSKIIGDISDFKQSFAATHVNFEVEQFNVEDNVKLLTESMFAEMLTTLDSYALEALFSRDVSKADAVEILRLESILDTVVGDSAEVSEYAHNSKADVYRALIGALPCLLEYFSDPEKSSHEDCAAVARMMAFVEENHELNNNYSSRFSDMISPFDLAPLLEWIIRSSDGDRSSFLWLVSVVDACRNDTSTLDGRVSRSRSVSKRFNDWVKEVNIPARVIAPQSGNGDGNRHLRVTSLPLRRSKSLLKRMATAKSPFGREEDEPKAVKTRHVKVAPNNGFGPTISSMKNKDDEVTRVNVQQAWV
ncbi:hypothetical protein NFJ02_39g97270 [Pycnococcus provasolii]